MTESSQAYVLVTRAAPVRAFAGLSSTVRLSLLMLLQVLHAEDQDGSRQVHRALRRLPRMESVPAPARRVLAAVRAVSLQAQVNPDLRQQLERHQELILQGDKGQEGLAYDALFASLPRSTQATLIELVRICWEVELEDADGAPLSLTLTRIADRPGAPARVRHVLSAAAVVARLLRDELFAPAAEVGASRG